MKKVIFLALSVCLSMAIIPGVAKAAPDSLRTQIAIPSAESQILINRLEEIRAMDRSALSKDERKALRKEVRSIDKQLRTFSGGIYISVGTLILILILLVLFT